MRRVTVTVGERFNKLIVISEPTTQNGFSVVKCRCDCGNEPTVRVAELRSGHKKSCGCISQAKKFDSRDAELVGKKFGRLTVKKVGGVDNRGYRLCECTCDCGTWVKIRIARMVSGEAQSCGCLQLEKAMETMHKLHQNQVTHGLSGTLTGVSWMNMMQRCYNPYSEQYHRYGSIGILACEFIRTSPVNLMLLIGERPNAAMSLDRIDNDLGYFCGKCAECLENQWPTNVRWATASEQAINRSSTRWIEIDGVVKAASEWCKLLGLPYNSKKIYTYPKKHE